VLKKIDYFIASTPLIIYGFHQYFRNKYASAIINYESEQKYQSNRYKYESYHFEKMDDKAYYRAIRNYNFWKTVANWSLFYKKRIEKPIVRIGGGGS
jgi:CRISPR/Cas system-associated protein Cas5 (RAMP superfamily)